MRYIIGAKWSFFEKMHFFCKIFLKSLPVQKKCVSLHRQTKTRVWYSKIGIWCNGNTTDSGPVILGSSPSTPTQKIAKQLKFSPWRFFFFYCSKRSSSLAAFLPIMSAGRITLEPFIFHLPSCFYELLHRLDNQRLTYKEDVFDLKRE